MARTNKPRRVPRRRVRKARKVNRRKNNNVAEYASMSVKRSMTTTQGTSFSPNTLYSLMNTTLSQFIRAQSVASAYQFYRIRKIALTVKPLYDSYTIDLSGTTAIGVGKPNFYYMIDKSGALPSNISLEGLKAMGARPRQLDEKNITVSWSPSVLDLAMTATTGTNTTQPAKYKISPWLNTNAATVGPGVWTPNDVDHLGIYWYIDQFASVYRTVPLYNCEVEVQFEFKKPLTLLTSSNEASPAVFPAVNDSKDGIIGGNDGV